MSYIIYNNDINNLAYLGMRDHLLITIAHRQSKIVILTVT